MLDLWILGGLALFGALGFYTGAIQQFAQVVGLIVAYVCAKPVAAAAAPGLAERMGWPELPTRIGLSALLLPIILFCAARAARAVLNALIPGKQRNQPDRLAGLVLGAGKAGVLAWALLSVVLTFEKPLLKLRPGLEDVLDESKAAEFARERNFFAEAAPAALERLKALSAVRNDPETAEALRENPAFQSLIEDGDVKKALEKGDAASLLGNPKVLKALTDPDLRKILDRPELKKLY